jgi:hypothetical protein
MNLLRSLPIHGEQTGTSVGMFGGPARGLLLKQASFRPETGQPSPG